MLFGGSSIRKDDDTYPELPKSSQGPKGPRKSYKDKNSLDSKISPEADVRKFAERRQTFVIQDHSCESLIIIVIFMIYV